MKVALVITYRTHSKETESKRGQTELNYKLHVAWTCRLPTLHCAICIKAVHHRKVSWGLPIFTSFTTKGSRMYLRQLHWLKAPERVEFKLAVLVYKCRQWTAPSYLFEELCQLADFEARRRLRSTSSSSLVVRHTRLSTIGDRAFPVAAARIWNGLPLHPRCPVFAVV